jgi:hypothetical protein
VSGPLRVEPESREGVERVPELNPETLMPESAPIKWEWKPVYPVLILLSILFPFRDN